MIVCLLSMAVILCFQTKLHDGVCQKRQAATIATHDLKSVKLPLKYDAQFPQLLQVLGIFTIMKYIKISELIHGRELFA